MGRRLSDFHGEGLIFEGAYELNWQELPAPLQPVQLARLNASNEVVLQSVAALEEYRHSVASEEQGSLENDIVRIDNKLNVLLDMVSRLLKEQRDIPEAVPVLLSVQAIEWWSEARKQPIAGQDIKMHIYLNPVYPSPLELPGTVEVTEQLDDGISHVVVSFAGLSGTVLELFEKFIFRHHRRSVALSRRLKKVE